MAFRPVQQYKIAVTGTASAAQLMAEFESAEFNCPEIQAMVYAKGCDIVVKMLDVNTVAADATPTSNKLAIHNFIVPQGAIFLIGTVKKYISAISEDETSTGTLFLTIGYNEKV